MDTAKNKKLVRELVAEFDRNWGGSSDFLDKWFTDDCRIHFNGATMDLAAYKEILPGFYSAFSDIHHDIHFMLADGDFVTNVVTLSVKHVGEWEGIAPTGRTVSISDIAVVRMQDGKVAEEWVVADMASLRQQLASEVQV